MITSGERRSLVIKETMHSMINAVESSDIDYISIGDPTTLEDIDEIRTDVLIALAVRFGRARLIDNLIIKVENHE
jgi:pantoate--beta-alanine ligase